MNRAYIGIVTRSGLESLKPECESTARASAQRAYRSRPLRGGCYWATLADAAAAEVLSHLARGDRHEALAAIDRSAAFVGPILPAGPPLIACD
jgi:hypothetical protein